MAPQNWKRVPKRKSNSIRRQTSFTPSNTYVPSLSVSLSTLNSEPVVIKDKPVIENKILYYLRKLKDRYWNPSSLAKSTDNPPLPYGHKESGRDRFSRYNSDTRRDRVNKNVIKPMEPRPGRYSSQNQYNIEKRYEVTNPRLPLLNEFANASCKAQDIVSAAIEYGLANGIVSKNGKYFWMSEGKLAKRSMTPGLALRKKRRVKKSHDHTTKSEHSSTRDTCAMPKTQGSQFSYNSGVKRRKSFSHTPKKTNSSVSRIFPKKTEKRPLKSCLNKKTMRTVKTRRNIKRGHKKVTDDLSRPISISSSTGETTSSSAELNTSSPPRKKKKSSSKAKDILAKSL